MGRMLIVSRADQLDAYKQLAEEYSVGFEINDFFAPEVLDDEDKVMGRFMML